MVLFDGEGAPSPAPPQGDILLGPVYGTMPEKNRVWAGTPGRPFWGYHLHCPPSGWGRSAGGAGGVGREENSIRVRLPRLAPLQGSRRYCLRSGAEDPWRASMVLFDGEGAPSPAPPRGDCHHGPVHGVTPGKNRVWAGTPGRPFRGYHLHCPRPGEGRSAGGTGGVGREENSIRVCLPRLAPFPGYLHEISRSCAGGLWKGRRGSL